MTSTIFYNKSTAGLLKALCILLVAVTLNALPRIEHPPTGRGSGCKAKELTELTRMFVSVSLISYEKANGPNIQYWPIRFPDLDINSNSSSPEERVRCGLDFMAKALKEILSDQKNMNPDQTTIHDDLMHSINTVGRLSACLNNTIGGNCTQKPSHPKMPPQEALFQRKQWSTSLLEKSQRFLVWVKSKARSPGVKDQVRV